MKDAETYKLDLLSKYRSKTISPNERFELEKLALDDPFLFEALEGYANNTASEKFGNFDRTKSSRGKYQWISAATVLILLSSAIWFSLGKLNVENQHAEQTTVSKKVQANQPSDIASSKGGISDKETLVGKRSNQISNQKVSTEQLKTPQVVDMQKMPQTEAASKNVSDNIPTASVPPPTEHNKVESKNEILLENTQDAAQVEQSERELVETEIEIVEAEEEVGDVIKEEMETIAEEEFEVEEQVVFEASEPQEDRSKLKNKANYSADVISSASEAAIQTELLPIEVHVNNLIRNDRDFQKLEKHSVITLKLNANQTINILDIEPMPSNKVLKKLKAKIIDGSKPLIFEADLEYVFKVQ